MLESHGNNIISNFNESDSIYNNTLFENATSNQEDVDVESNNTVIRKFINSAVYIEETIDVMPTYRENYPRCKIVKTKVCTCSVNSRNCQFHTTTTYLPSIETSNTSTETSTTTSSSSKTDIESVTTLKGGKEIIKLPLTPSTPSGSVENNNNNNNAALENEAVKSWLAKKDLERKKKQKEDCLLREQKEKERQLILEKERANFREWLMRKRKEDEVSRRFKEIELQEEKIKRAEKERRQLESELNFKLWLKKKEESELDKKIQEEMRIIRLEEEKQKRIEENQKAFQDWCNHSKKKPKPLPLNKGLDSLRSSVSVAYINPIPWSPNIESNATTTRERKPTSQ